MLNTVARTLYTRTECNSGKTNCTRSIWRRLRQQGRRRRRPVGRGGRRGVLSHTAASWVLRSLPPSSRTFCSQRVTFASPHCLLRCLWQALERARHRHALAIQKNCRGHLTRARLVSVAFGAPCLLVRVAMGPCTRSRSGACWSNQRLVSALPRLAMDAETGIRRGPGRHRADRRR